MLAATAGAVAGTPHWPVIAKRLLGTTAGQGRSAGGPAGWRVSTARHGVTV
jgi:hypothetical protein